MVDEVVDAEHASSLSLTNEDIVRLAKLAADLEQRFQSPRDIEFAIVPVGDDGATVVHLLQSRPITTLHTWTDDQLLHEFDNGVTSNDDIFTNPNVGSV